MLPEDGGNAPVIMLKSVVFPAPLGPMKPQICRSGISKLTSFKAATPPKCFVSPVTLRISTISSKQFSQQPQQPVRLEQNNQYQQCAIKQQMDLGKVRYQFFLHNTKNQSTQDCAPYGANTANHRHEQNRNAGSKSKHALRVNVARI